MALKKFDSIRDSFIESIVKSLTEQGEDVQRTGSNEIAFPIVAEDGDEAFIKMVFSVPTGSRDGDAYDAYEVAKSYAMKVAEDKAKAEKRAKEKSEKIERDRKAREERARAKAKAKEKKGE